MTQRPCTWWQQSGVHDGCIAWLQ